MLTKMPGLCFYSPAPSSSADVFHGDKVHGIACLQVHKARLFDGREVAVKVQYLGLETAVTADFTTLTVLAKAAAKWFPNSLDFG